MLLLAAGVGQAQVNEFDALFLDEIQNVGWRHEISSITVVVRKPVRPADQRGPSSVGVRAAAMHQ
jgi:hypothetical protein